MLLDSDASGSELLQLEYNSCRKVLFLDSHASQPLNGLVFNAILKETQSSIRLSIDYFSMQVLTLTSQKIINSGPLRLRLSIDGFSIESDSKSLTNSGQPRFKTRIHSFSIQLSWKHIDSAQSRFSLRVDSFSIRFF